MTRAATFRSRITRSRWRTRSKSPLIRVSASQSAIKSCTDRVALFHVVGDPVPCIAVGSVQIKWMVLRRPCHGAHYIVPAVSFPVFCTVLYKVVETIVVKLHRRDDGLLQFGIGGMRMRAFQPVEGR